MAGTGKKNRFLTRSRRSSPLLVAKSSRTRSWRCPFTGRVPNLYFLPRTGGWGGKIQFFFSRPSVVCHRLNNSLCLPWFLPRFLRTGRTGTTTKYSVEIFWIRGIGTKRFTAASGRYKAPISRRLLWKRICFDGVLVRAKKTIRDPRGQFDNLISRSRARGIRSACHVSSFASISPFCRGTLLLPRRLALWR